MTTIEEDKRLEDKRLVRTIPEDTVTDRAVALSNEVAAGNFDGARLFAKCGRGR